MLHYTGDQTLVPLFTKVRRSGSTPVEPKPKTPFKKNKVPDKPKSPHLVDAKTMERDVQKTSIIFALVTTESPIDPPLDTPPEAIPILTEFS